MSTEKKMGNACKLVYDTDEPVSRRDFLGIAAMWSCAVAWLLAFIGLAKFPLPALLPDISSVFKIGEIEEIPIGSQKIFEDKKVVVMRDESGIRAVSLVCTHLGCIVSENGKGGWKCPCHGSKFDEKGNVTGGPAPKGLNWLEVSQLPSGKLVVNMDKIVSQETRYIV
ncbi:MAG: Rieske 2Fe-2S domain-containing protein [Candidatus Omnitrophica bacterium]|nr:Rieske 2Fe-2S domain-containing protein [Candidatus Omnitrophota bacterium]